MTKIAEYEVRVHPTKDKKKLKSGIKEYEYGTINIRDLELRTHIGKTVKVTVMEPEHKSNKFKYPSKKLVLRGRGVNASEENGK